MKTFLILCLFFLFPLPAFAQTITGWASHYGKEQCRYNPSEACPMANQESLYAAIQKEKADESYRYAAMYDVPFGTRVNVCNRNTQVCREFTVTDRGPNRRFHKEKRPRIIDLSSLGFREIAEGHEGLIPVTVEVLKWKKI